MTSEYQDFEQAQSQPAGYHGFLQELARSKHWFILGLALALCVAVLYLRWASYTYTAELKIVAAQPVTGNGTSDTLGSLAAVAGLRLQSKQKVSPIDLYKAQIYSRVVADRLSTHQDLMRHVFASEWDAAKQQWRQPDSRLRRISHFIKSLIGIPIAQWQPPAGARLNDYISGAVIIGEDDLSPVITLKISDVDPRFAVAFLTRLHHVTDTIIRQKDLNKSSKYIKYLEVRLPTVTVLEQRAALASLLSEQEYTQMLTSLAMPYASDAIDAPHASTLPTWPKPWIVLLAAIMLGLAAAMAAVLIRMQLRPRL